MIYSYYKDLEDFIIERLGDSECGVEAMHSEYSEKYKPVTKQAVYKTLKKLCNDEIIIKHKDTFSINNIWKKRVVSLLEHSNRFPSLKEGESIAYSFKSFKQLDEYWKHIQEGTLEDAKTTYFFCPHQYWWFVPGRRESEVTFYKSFEENKEIPFISDLPYMFTEFDTNSNKLSFEEFKQKIYSFKCKDLLFQYYKTIDNFKNAFTIVNQKYLISGVQEIIKPLIEILHLSDPPLKCLILQVLGNLREKQSVSHIIKLMDDAKSSVREFAVEALGKINIPLSVNSLMEKGLKDRSPDVRLKAAKSLVSLGDPKAIESIIKVKEREGIFSIKIKKELEKAIKELAKKTSHDKIKEELLREGIQKGNFEGKKEIICKFLQSRFEIKSIKLQEKIKEIKEPAMLDKITDKIFKIEDIEKVQMLIDEILE